MKLAGHEFEDRELIRRALRNMRPRRGERNVYRWVMVKNLFGVGSTVAHALCAEFNMNPDEVIK